MKVEVDIPEDKIDEVVAEIFENFPEYAQSFDCLQYNYDKFVFEFRDQEDRKKYIIRKPEARKGFSIFVHELLKGEIKPCGIDSTNFMDSGAYDADAADMILQYSIFGELVYG